MTINKSILSVAILALVFATNTASAGWVNDWVTQSIGDTGTYARDQGRGFASIGTYSKRWNRGNPYTPVISFQRPKLQLGCGGIDATLGGFSFADPDALVAKFQGIVQNAPALMFQVALSQVSEQLSNAMNWLDDKLSFLSGLSQSECQQAKNLAAWTRKNVGPIDTALSAIEDFTRVDSERASENGVSKSFDAGQRNAKSNDTTLTDEVAERANCPSEIKAYLPVNPGDSVSLLKTFLTDNGLSQYNNTFRGILGDVVIAIDGKDGKNYQVREVSRCFKNDDASFENLLDGTLEAKKLDTLTCELDDANRFGLESYVQTQLQAIVSQIKNRQQLSTSSDNFINSLPNGIYRRLVDAATVGNDVAVVNEITLPVATALAYQSMEDVYRSALGGARDFYSAIKNKPDQLAKCKLSSANKAAQALDAWRKQLYPLLSAYRQFYVARATEYNTSVQTAIANDMISSSVERQIRQQLKKVLQAGQ